MGSDRHYREERAAHQVTVGPFEIQKTEVTNAEFAEFVAETNYVTTAEQDLDPQNYPGVAAYLLKAGSMVFAQPPDTVDTNDFRKWWRYVAGANWQHPTGPKSTIDGLENHPVVQISPEDAAAYAKWAGGRLPTEAEWEFAARGGLNDADYTWGKDYDPSQGWKANSWQGKFPSTDTKDDGYHGTAPVGSYVANGYGLFDMAGNVWEHVSDWWVPFHATGGNKNPQGPDKATAATYANPAFAQTTSGSGLPGMSPAKVRTTKNDRYGPISTKRPQDEDPRLPRDPWHHAAIAHPARDRPVNHPLDHHGCPQCNLARNQMHTLSGQPR